MALPPDLLVRQGQAAFAAGRIDEAERAAAAACAAQPQSGEAWMLAALVALNRGTGPAAMAAARKAATLSPRSPAAWNTLGLAAERADDGEEAVRAYRRAIKLRDEVAVFHYNLGNALFAQGKVEQALNAFRTASRRDPDFPPAWNNAGKCLKDLGHWQDALEAYGKALALRPSYEEAKFNTAWVLLTLGRFDAGWPLYEHRWGLLGTPDRRTEFPEPRWDGRPLAGERLLLWAEQGFGDTLQFIRYGAAAARHGATVVVEADPSLVRLLATAPGIAEVHPTGAAPPVELQLPLASAPGLFGFDGTPTHPAPYLAPPVPGVPALPLRPGRLKVGVVWGGRRLPDPGRTCPMREFRALFEVPGIAFHSLQMGEWRADLEGVLPEKVCDLAPLIGDFADTAALLGQLDLVVTIDSAMAHLAGALGRPCWTLLPWKADWRWLLDRDDSPWYPATRLFRQRRPGDWAELIRRVAAELEARATAAG